MGRAISQQEHSKINIRNYPGTRQLCCLCGDETEKCEEDGYYDDDGNSYCELCYNAGLRIKGD